MNDNWDVQLLAMHLRRLERACATQRRFLVAAWVLLVGDVTVRFLWG